MWFMNVRRFIVLSVIAAAAVYVAGVLLKSEGRAVASTTAPNGGKTAEGFEGFEVSGRKGGDKGNDKGADATKSEHDEEDEEMESGDENDSDGFVDDRAKSGGVSGGSQYTAPTMRANEDRAVGGVNGGTEGGGDKTLQDDRRGGADAALVEYMMGLEDRLSRLADGLDDALEALQLRRKTLEAGITVSLGSKRDDYTVEKLETVPPMTKVEAFSPFMGAY
jgi:hypothetical protein